MHRNRSRLRRFAARARSRPSRSSQNPGPKGPSFRAFRLFRANLDSPRHLDEMLLYAERLSCLQRRRVLDLNCYGRKLERIMDALLRL